MLHENEGRTNIFKADHFFQTKLVWGTDIFSEIFGPRTVISGTNFPVTELFNRCRGVEERPSGYRDHRRERERDVCPGGDFLSDVHFSDLVTLRSRCTARAQ